MNAVLALLCGVGGMVCLVVLWVWVQRCWGELFGARGTDVLALRGGCGACVTPCETGTCADRICSEGEPHATG